MSLLFLLMMTMVVTMMMVLLYTENTSVCGSPSLPLCLSLSLSPHARSLSPCAHAGFTQESFQIVIYLYERL